MNYCPNCGYHLADAKPLTEETVKQGLSTYDLVSDLERNADPARYSFSEPDKGSGRNVSKSSLSSMITRDQVKEIRRLYEKGLSLARIRQQLALNVSLNRIQTVVNKPW